MHCGQRGDEATDNGRQGVYSVTPTGLEPGTEKAGCTGEGPGGASHAAKAGGPDSPTLRGGERPGVGVGGARDMGPNKPGGDPTAWWRAPGLGEKARPAPTVNNVTEQGRAGLFTAPETAQDHEQGSGGGGVARGPWEGKRIDGWMNE